MRRGGTFPFTVFGAPLPEARNRTTLLGVAVRDFPVNGCSWECSAGHVAPWGRICLAMMCLPQGVSWLEARGCFAHLRASPKMGSCISLSSLPFLRYAGPDGRVERGVVRIPRCEARGTH